MWCRQAAKDGIHALPAPDNAKDQRRPHRVEWAGYRKPLHDAAYWAEKTRDFAFTAEDRVDAARSNQILWAGLKGENVPYPTVRDSRNLRHNRRRRRRSLNRKAIAESQTKLEAQE